MKPHNSITAPSVWEETNKQKVDTQNRLSPNRCFCLLANNYFMAYPAANCGKQIQQTKEKAKELKNGPSAPDYKVDDHLLDVSDDEDIVVKDDSNATKNQINYQKK